MLFNSMFIYDNIYVKQYCTIHLILNILNYLLKKKQHYYYKNHLDFKVGYRTSKFRLHLFFLISVQI